MYPLNRQDLVVRRTWFLHADLLRARLRV